MTIPTAASPPEPRGANRKAVGLLLAPGPGRLTALVIAGVPLIILLLIGFTTAGNNGGDSSGDNGQSTSQYPVGGTANQNADGSGQGGFSPSAQAATQSTDQPTATASPSPDITDSSTDTATAFATDAASDSAFASASASDSASDSAAPSPTATGPAAAVLAAYADVNRGQYQAAYNLGLERSQESYTTFVREYSQFTSVSVDIRSVQGDTVQASLMIAEVNGSSVPAYGTYTVLNGEITSDLIQQ